MHKVHEYWQIWSQFLCRWRIPGQCKICSTFVCNTLQLSPPLFRTRCPEYETVHSEYAGGDRLRGAAVINTTKTRVSNAKVCWGRVFVQVHIIIIKKHPTSATIIVFIFLISHSNFYFPNPSGDCDLWCAPWNKTRQKSIQPSNNSPIRSSVWGRCDILWGESIFTWRRFNFCRG